MSLSKRAKIFLEKTSRDRPDLEILGDYQGSNKKLLVRGTGCGHEWKTTPNNIRIGIGCPTCFNSRLSKTLTYSDDKFRSKLEKLNPNYSSTSQYSKSTDYIGFHCSIHNFDWSMRAGHVQHDSCKMCKLDAKAIKISDEILANYMVNGEPSIQLLTNYIDYITPITWMCVYDGYESSTKPLTLKSGKVICPVCTKNQNIKTIIAEIISLQPNLIFLDDIYDIDEPVYIKLDGDPEVWEDTLRNIRKFAKSGKYNEK